jgi:putative two-component system response regulator
MDSIEKFLMGKVLSEGIVFQNGENTLHALHIQTITDLLLGRLLTKTDRYPISARDRERISKAAALHDIGKTAVPPEILNKPGKLTKEEYAVVKTHTVKGAEILENAFLENASVSMEEPAVRYAYEICRWHHERYDGKGYPDGLKGDEIPISAQVVGLADVYDAMTSKRVYKKAYSHEKTMEMIEDGQCGAFQPLLLECLKEVADDLQQVTGGGETEGR